MGLPGSGKSLIFEALGGVQRPGVTAVGTAEGLRTTLLPQDSRLCVLPTDEVWMVLSLSPWALRTQRLTGWRWKISEREERAHQLMLKLRLDPDRISLLRFRSLSTSERRRVLLCSALLSNPELLLFDGWDEMMDARDRKAIAAVLDEKMAEGMAVLASSRRTPLADFPGASVHDLGSDEAAEPLALPLIQRSNSSITHAHPLLEVNRLTVTLGSVSMFRRRPAATVVDGASLFVRHGETLVLLGPSGSGKTTLLHAIAGLQSPTSGTIRVENVDLTHARGARAKRLRKSVQVIFQNASAALDGPRTVKSHLEEAQELTSQKSEAAAQWLDKLGLAPRLLAAPADQLSMSESQRLDLARSLVLSPRLVLFDAPQGSGANADNGLLAGLIHAQKADGKAFLIATSDPAIAESLADRVAVLHAGRVIELGSREEVLKRPAHPASRALIFGTSKLEPHNPTAPHVGCPYVGQCPRRELPLCDEKEPMLAPLNRASSGGRRVACFHPITKDPASNSD